MILSSGSGVAWSRRHLTSVTSRWAETEAQGEIGAPHMWQRERICSTVVAQVLQRLKQVFELLSTEGLGSLTRASLQASAFPGSDSPETTRAKLFA